MARVKLSGYSNIPGAVGGKDDEIDVEDPATVTFLVEHGMGVNLDAPKNIPVAGSAPADGEPSRPLTPPADTGNGDAAAQSKSGESEAPKPRPPARRN